MASEQATCLIYLVDESLGIVLAEVIDYVAFIRT